MTAENYKTKSINLKHLYNYSISISDNEITISGYTKEEHDDVLD